MKTLEGFIEDFENTVEGVEPGTLDAQTVYRSLKQWDSLATLMFIDMVDAEYDVRLTSKQLKEAETLEGLYEIIGPRMEDR